MRPLCGTYIIVTMASLVSAPAPHPRSSRQISSCHTWMMTRARRIPHNKLYLLHPISDTCAQGYTHVILLFHSRYSIILYWNVPCWGHQLWDINCCMCVCLCVCVSVSQCICLSADISLYCAKNDSTDYPEIVWVCWVWRCHECIKFWLRTN